MTLQVLCQFQHTAQEMKKGTTTTNFNKENLKDVTSDALKQMWSKKFKATIVYLDSVYISHKKAHFMHLFENQEQSYIM